MLANANKVCYQHSQDAIFLCNFQKYSVKILYAIQGLSVYVWEFKNNALWDTH